MIYNGWSVLKYNQKLSLKSEQQTKAQMFILLIALNIPLSTLCSELPSI